MTLTPFARALVESLAPMAPALAEPRKVAMAVFSPFEDKDPDAPKEKDGKPSLSKSILNILNGPRDSVERLAFESDPALNTTYQGLFRQKTKLLPDAILKRIMIQDDLVAAIINTRANHISSFGRERPDRFSVGFAIEPNDTADLTAEQKKDLQNKIDEASKRLLTCGSPAGWDAEDKLTFSQYLFMSTKNAVGLGRIATEIIWVKGADGQRKFHSFRPIDVGTIYRAAPQKEAARAVRKQARQLLESLKNKKIEPERYLDDEYAWVQVIDGKPLQAFTSEECVVHNFYPSVDVELDGYPVTPLDTVISAVTMHINITTHNKNYFQSGRASRGMLVIKSDDIDESIIARIRQQFNASINNSNNAWRMPVFGIGAQDEIEWASIDSGQRDMEFQYLSDSNARVILSAFQMSPEELPGYAHLCVSRDTGVWTDVHGFVTIGDILGDAQEVGAFKVWTGTGWSPARAFVTGQRPVRRTDLSNGVELVTSPEHRFRVVGPDGDLGWKQQAELSLGDVVLVNRQVIPGDLEAVPSYKGQRLTVEMMEVLGWLTGDGTITVRRKGLRKHSKNLEFYYHHDKEPWIRQRHADYMAAFGLKPLVKDRQISLKTIEVNKERCGFHSISEVRRLTYLYDTEFVDWLLSLGFVPSSQNKAIPAFLHKVPVEYRRSFLRGFFSADGSKDDLDTPSISISAEETREAVKRLLLSMGLRTRHCEGTSKLTWSKNEDGSYSRKRVKAASKLIVKDKQLFYDRVGFLQPHKQPSEDLKCLDPDRWDKTAKSVAVSLANKILEGPLKGAGHEARDEVRHALKDPPHTFQSLAKVKSMALRFDIALPSWLDDYYQEEIVALTEEDGFEEMVDIEVYDEYHAFMADGVLVHNSRGTANQALSESNQEYLLIAHRDVGIRPLLHQWQDFVNAVLFPLISPELSKTCTVKLLGLEAETAEKESIRIQQDAPVHMTYDEILAKVEKDPVGKQFGGEFPLNPAFQQILDKYMTVGQILEQFFGIAGASQQPQWAYVRDPFWMQWQQLNMQAQQMQAQAQAAQQGGGGPPPDKGGGGGGGGKPSGGGPPPDQGSADAQSAQQDDQKAAASAQDDLTRGVAQAQQALGKGEKNLPPSKRKLLAQQKLVVDGFMTAWKDASQEAVAEIARAVSRGH